MTKATVVVADCDGTNGIESPQAGMPAVPPPTDIYLSPTAFRVFWWSIICFHVFNALFIFGVGAVQSFISLPQVYANLWLINIPPSMLLLAGASYLLVSAFHIVLIARHIWQSFRYGRLSFNHEGKSKVYLVESSDSQPIFYRVVIDIWSRYLGTNGLFSVRGSQFYIGFYVRQIVAILLQTFQAYQLSGSVTSPTINQFLVALVVTNCVYTPVIDWLLANKHAARRVAHIVMNLLLDFTIAVLVPVIICFPHALEFDWTAWVYPDSYVYNEVWLSKTITEVRQVMVSSSLDYLSSTLLLVGGLMDLSTLKEVFHRVEHADSERAKAIRKSTLLMASRSNLRGSTSLYRLRRALRVFTTAWAVFVLSMHFMSQKQSGVSCSLHVNAWFATNVSCSIVQLNCNRMNSTGSSVDVAAALVDFERSHLTKLVLSHCTALEVPAIVREFPQLTGFETYNSTLTAWPSSAAITSSTHPHLDQLQFILTNVSQFPESLLRNDLPPTMSLSFYGSNLTSLPPTVGVAWANRAWVALNLEHTQLTTLPDAFRSLSIKRLSLVGSRITQLADDLFTQQHFVNLRLSDNPLTALPASIGDTTALTQLLVENTTVATVPDWLLRWWRARDAASAVSFVGSPFCRTQQELTTSTACSTGVSDAQRDDFRYDLIAPQRPL